MLTIIMSDAVREKIKVKHGGITAKELQQCFENRHGVCLLDDREDH